MRVSINEYFIIEILVLHDKNEMPILSPLGKIAGINKMEVKHSYRESQSFFDDVFSGSLIVHLIRLFGYTIAFLIVLLFILFIGDKIDKIRIRQINHKRFLLVRNLEFFDEISINNKKVISKILICMPHNKWKEVLNSLNTYKFHRDILEIAPDNIFDDFCKQYDEYSLYNKPIAAYTDDYLPFSTYNTMVAIGSLLHKNKLLGEESELENLCYSKVNVQFLKDMSDSIDYLDKFSGSFISQVIH